MPSQTTAPAFDGQRLLLLILFAGSGCSALIYEIVWYQLLQLAIGSTAVSLGILLATFMGGLCIGSYLLPRLFARSRRHPLAIYAGIEAGIALLGLAELVLIPLIDSVYVSGTQTGLAGMLWRGLVCAVCLLPPTILMGASLPAIVRWVQGNTKDAPWWGLLYGANTLGAVFGCLLAGFYLLRLFDVHVATYAAAAVNLAVAAASLLLARRTPAAAPVATPVDAGPRDWAVYVAIACSGATALGAEVVWTRIMGLLLGATVYAFSIILAVFLIGLAIGTTWGSSLVKRVSPRAGLGWAQLLAALGIAWTAWSLSDVLPYWPVDPLLAHAPRFTFQLDMVRCLWAILPPALAWGASFPLAFAAAAKGGDPGRTVGGVYAANTLGAIVGALLVSLVLIPWIGTLGSQRLLLAVAALSGLLLLAPVLMEDAWEKPALLVAALVLAGVLAWKMDPIPGELIAYGRRMPVDHGYSDILYTAEGRNTSIAISHWRSNDALQFHVAGKVEASSTGVDMKLQRMLGHIPALMHKDPKSVLVVGFGAGVTAGSFTRYPGIKRIEICELEPLIPPTTTHWFARQNYDVMHDKRTQIVFDDARHFVLTTPEKFDIITSDPIHPFVKGSAALYSKEYFEMVKAHLNPGGMVTQWVPLYESDAPSVKSEIASFFAVFPGAMIFANTDGGEGYDVVLVGQKDNQPINLDAIETKLARPDYAPVVQSLRDAGLPTAQSLFSTYAADDTDLKGWLADAQINHDYDMRLQYLAGLALNADHADEIYRDMLKRQQQPGRHFNGTPPELEAVLSTIAARSYHPNVKE